ncbi:hypothetical protein ZEAMMB73_Zm00001d012232 [Zea mays]|uniref:Uncharacterized protein n=1 Tax=Zea mays TaxID=4577 RepID=A0A1D6G7L9_MAIZE|nr:hypothetical protein ZEAMMB73_Zm00001d012232 [Zea mays]
MPITICMHHSVQQVGGVIQMQVCTLFNLLPIHIEIAQSTPGDGSAFRVRVCCIFGASQGYLANPSFREIFYVLPMNIVIETLLNSHLILQMQASTPHPNTDLYEALILHSDWVIQIITGINGTARWHKVGHVLTFGIIDIERTSMFHFPHSLLCEKVYNFLSEMCLSP